MMEYHLQYPAQQMIDNSDTLLEMCHKARTASEDIIVFDLSETQFITPFGIILVAGTISECISKGKKAKYKKPEKATTDKFLSGIGFNDFFKLSNSGYRIESPNIQLRRMHSIDYLLTNQILEVFGYSLAMSDGIKGSLKMALNELMMNVFDHSESQRGCYVCAQSYPRQQKIRLCIADFGIGILCALRKNVQLSGLDDDYEAIMTAIKEGVTSRPGGFAGYGLTHINRFIEVNNGRMHILSGNGKALWNFSKTNGGKVKKQIMRAPFQGTIVKLEINADKDGFYFLQSENGNIF